MSEVAAPEKKPRIAVIGGTGALGSGLARRWAEAGYAVVIGSREAAKARAAAAAIAPAAGLPPVEGMAQAEAAAAAEVIVLTVPYAAHA
ncbi:MAG: NAD(P)-binding domain-containing protein, partial [Acetobacteraceae bacterium]